MGQSSSAPLRIDSDPTFSPSLWLTRPRCCLIPFPLLFLRQLSSTGGNFQEVDPLWSCCQTPGRVGQGVCVCSNADSRARAHTLVCIRWLTESAGGIPVMTRQPSHPGRSDSRGGSAEWLQDWAACLMKGRRPGGHCCELMKYTSPLLRGGASAWECQGQIEMHACAVFCLCRSLSSSLPLCLFIGQRCA